MRTPKMTQTEIDRTEQGCVHRARLIEQV